MTFFDDSSFDYPSTRQWYEPPTLRNWKIALWICSIAAFAAFLLRYFHLWTGYIALVLSFAAVAVLQSRRWRFFRSAAPLCTYCGYNLTGLPDEHRCPECGEAFSLADCFAYQKDPVGFRRAKEREEWLRKQA